MSNGVEFDVDVAPRSQYRSDVPKLTQFVLRHSFGVIRDEEQANYVLVGITIALVSISAYIFYSSTAASSGLKPTPEQLNQLLQVPFLQ